MPDATDKKSTENSPKDSSFWIVLGDVHNDTSKLAHIPELADASGVIISGDMSNVGSKVQVERILDTFLQHNPRLLAQVGNMDLPESTAILQERHCNLHREVKELAKGLGVMGVGYSSPTPFHTPSEATEDDLSAWLSEGGELLRAFACRVAVIHTPPHNTNCDRISNGMHVGSMAVRKFIEIYQPDVCITGHIHESVGSDCIGKTQIINPGELAMGGYVRLDYDGKMVQAHFLQCDEQKS